MLRLWGWTAAALVSPSGDRGVALGGQHVQDNEPDSAGLAVLCSRVCRQGRDPGLLLDLVFHITRWDCQEMFPQALLRPQSQHRVRQFKDGNSSVLPTAAEILYVTRPFKSFLADAKSLQAST